jgi:hypothetical protein
LLGAAAIIYHQRAIEAYINRVLTRQIKGLTGRGFVLDDQRRDVPGEAADAARLAHVGAGVGVRDASNPQLRAVANHLVLARLQSPQRLVVLQPLDLNVAIGNKRKLAISIMLLNQICDQDSILYSCAILLLIGFTRP